MKEKNTQNNNDIFLKKNTSDVTQHHKNYLGKTIPKDYFAKSKSSILDKVKSEKRALDFLKEDFSDITEHHQEYLGKTIPENYFSKSKASILQKVKGDSSEDNFLKDNISDASQHHKTYLGTTVPKEYFSKSKSTILNKIKEEVKIEVAQPKKQLVFYMQPQFKYIAAASLIFLLSLTVWLQNSANQDDINNFSIDTLAFDDDILIESLLIEDKDVDAFADATLFNEIVVKAEQKERKLENLILDSLILEDSLLDDYMDDGLIETIIL